MPVLLPLLPHFISLNYMLDDSLRMDGEGGGCREGGGVGGDRRDPPRNLSPSLYTLVHNRSQSRSDQIGGSNSWFGMCAVPHRLL